MKLDSEMLELRRVEPWGPRALSGGMERSVCGRGSQREFAPLTNVTGARTFFIYFEILPVRLRI
jgi:hypothetical protein